MSDPIRDCVLPDTSDLTAEQYAGRACVWCGIRIIKGGVSAGIARGRQGAHILDIEVYACSACGKDGPQ